MDPRTDQEFQALAASAAVQPLRRPRLSLGGGFSVRGKIITVYYQIMEFIIRQLFSQLTHSNSILT